MGESSCALSTVAALRARELMEPAELTVGEHESLASAWEMLARSECRVLPVLRNGAVIGILDDHAVVCARSTRSIDGRQRQVGEFSRSARVFGPDAMLEVLLPALVDGGVAVVAEHGRVLGVVTCEHVTRVMAAALGTSGGHATETAPAELLGACVGSVVPAGPADA